jgi:transglutaminase/protease-like cytokinesis protein 3
MRKAAVILLLLLAHNVFAQQRQVSFSEIDDRVKSIEPAAPAELAYTLTKDYITDREKLRSIFSWIAEHITYRVKKNYRNITVNNYTSRPEFTDTSKWKSANDMVAETVLQNKSAVCDGYARLFKTLCDYAGLRSAIITGFAKGDLSRQLKFRCNHTWNAVYIDSAWRLLDVTWASGYTNYSGDEFVKRYDETYFLAAPEDFIRDHFPDDLRWTLMEKPTLPREFNSGPYKNKSFSKYRISSYSPGGGIIEAAIGDTIQIVLETGDPQADSKMAADTMTVFDSVLQKIIPSIAFAEPSATDKNKQQLRYSFCVENNNIEWLHIVYNHDIVLRYRLRIKKEKTGFAPNNKKELVYNRLYP